MRSGEGQQRHGVCGLGVLQQQVCQARLELDLAQPRGLFDDLAQAVPGRRADRLALELHTQQRRGALELAEVVRPHGADHQQRAGRGVDRLAQQGQKAAGRMVGGLAQKLLELVDHQHHAGFGVPAVQPQPVSQIDECWRGHGGRRIGGCRLGRVRRVRGGAVEWLRQVAHQAAQCIRHRAVSRRQLVLHRGQCLEQLPARRPGVGAGRRSALGGHARCAIDSRVVSGPARELSLNVLPVGRVAGVVKGQAQHGGQFPRGISPGPERLDHQPLCPVAPQQGHHPGPHQ